ncbi:transposase [Novosphingobium sp. Rr 2-17]|nr:transposase [Novosphingobium sp. Rr 2-17]
MERDEQLATSGDAITTKVTALSEIYGFGANFPAMLARELFYRRFGNRKQLASYVGLTPMPHQSGNVDKDRPIGRAGNARARKTLVQAAWLWLRYQPNGELAARFRQRVGELKGRTRRIAIVAMARNLLIALWRYTETGEIPTGTIFRAAYESQPESRWLCEEYDRLPQWSRKPRSRLVVLIGALPRA